MKLDAFNFIGEKKLVTAEKLSFGLFTHNFSFFNLQTQLESNNSKKKYFQVIGIIMHIYTIYGG